jgi:hypothetical protein
MFQSKGVEYDVCVIYAFLVHLMTSETQSNDCTIINNRLEKMWKETVVANLKALSRAQLISYFSDIHSVISLASF